MKPDRPLFGSRLPALGQPHSQSGYSRTAKAGGSNLKK